MKELGKGAFGRVVLGVERTSGAVWAIKILAKREVREGNMVEQLTRELKIQLFVNHPHVVKVHGYFDDLLHFYIVMECALDGHLSETLQRASAPLSEAAAAPLLHQLCVALAALHAEQIIHRDLKPENVMLHEVPRTLVREWSRYATSGGA